MRVGISYIAKIHGKANNKYMQSYDDKRPSKYICIWTQIIYKFGQ